MILKILFRVGWISENFVREWQIGKLKPTEKELNLLEEGCEEVLTVFDNHFKRELLAYQAIPYSIHHAEVKEKISKIKRLIQQERFHY